MVSVAVTCFTVMAVALFAVVAAGSDSLAVLVAMLFLAFAWLGLVIPSTMVLSLEDHGPIAGMASALGGTLQMITGAVMIVGRQRLLQRNGAANGDHDCGLRGRGLHPDAADASPKRDGDTIGRIITAFSSEACPRA